MWNNLPRLLADWKEMSSDGLSVGIVVLPSRERIIYEFFSRQNRLDELDPEFVAAVQKQVELEARMRVVLENSGLPFVFALEDVHVAHIYGRQHNIPTYPPRDDGHPVALGYAAYASAARRLVNKMGLQ